MRFRHRPRYAPYAPYPSPIYRRRPAGGVPGCVWLFLLGFILTSFLFVALWPHRVLILHLVIEVGIILALVLVLTLLLVITWKLRRPIRAWHTRRKGKGLRPLPRVHDAPHGEHFHERPSSRPVPPSHDLLYAYDYRTNQRPSEHLNPDQRSRF